MSRIDGAAHIMQEEETVSLLYNEGVAWLDAKLWNVANLAQSFNICDRFVSVSRRWFIDFRVITAAKMNLFVTSFRKLASWMHEGAHFW